MEIGMYVFFGEYLAPVAARKSIKGIPTGYFLVLWNVSKD